MSDSARITAILGNSQRLDGGAMFGNAPRALWSRWIEPDEHNRIPLACRAMLVEHQGRRILFETGIGAFFAPELRERFGVIEDRHVLLEGLAELGIAAGDVDVVVLSHLHFDHAGGLLTEYAEGAAPRLVFPRATFIVGTRAWQRACRPHSRDRRSFIEELPALLEGSGRLELVEGDHAASLGSLVRFHHSEGHTPGLLVSEVATSQGPVVFASDLIPGTPWVHVPITMGYDRNPELLIDEKTRLLTDLQARQGWLFFTHDHAVALARVERDPRGRFGVEGAVAQPVSWPD